MKIGQYDITGKACIMGILNVTPDSFSDGGSYTTIDSALNQVGEMLEQGVAIVDIGGESTRPGAVYVTAEEEIKRVVPMIKAIREVYPDLLLSIDTYKTEVAQAALDAGVHILNDVWSGLYDGKMLSLAAERNVPIILMHNQEEAVYQDIKKEVCEFLLERAERALEAGVS